MQNETLNLQGMKQNLMQTLQLKTLKMLRITQTKCIKIRSCLSKQRRRQSKLLAKLKSETFILDLAPKSPLPKLDGYQYRLVDTATLEVEVLREQGINSVFTQLSEQGIQVLSMRNKANRLEELFVSLVNEKQGDRA